MPVQHDLRIETRLNEYTSYLPHLNASLNGLATVLLLVGLWLIKAKLERAHKWVMIACFGVSTAFLASYLTYHFTVISQKFPHDQYPWAAVVYYVVLLTHILLAMAVPFLAIGSIWLGLKDRRKAHVRLSKWTFPIWLYVSVTGIVIYAMLYHLYLPKSPTTTMKVDTSGRVGSPPPPNDQRPMAEGWRSGLFDRCCSDIGALSGPAERLMYEDSERLPWLAC